MSRVWFITGASSGFGFAVTKAALQAGERVAATCRSPATAKDLQALQATYPEPALVIIQLDVTSHASVEAAFKIAVDRFGRLDVVFNNAGYGIISSVEMTKEAEEESTKMINTMFDTNFWGAAWVAREAVRVFREVNLQRKKEGLAGVESRMIVNSSAVVWTPGVHSLGYYFATKNGLEGLIETLATEVHPDWNVKITIIQPGVFRTSGIASVMTTPTHPAYGVSEYFANRFSEGFDNSADGDVNKAANAILKLSKMDAPPLRVPLGKDALAMAKMKLKALAEEVEKYEHLSEDLLL